MAKILVIDDDDQLRDLLVRVLKRAEHEVRHADNGRSGERECEAFQPDLVVTDIVMPEQEGIETIMSLRRHVPRLPIIAMSGGAMYGSGEYLDIARRLGAATLRKPFLPQDLLDAVDQALAAASVDQA